ncbi:hypothetical protein [Pectobacterium brasiliense]|uniref:hypothetical protein n=1 Tax=Pectobacterium brasiliense TaxID=180957 RepID=UPI001F0A744B|nr:hypothetical protein [Pectobacterium brasiliense]
MTLCIVFSLIAVIAPLLLLFGLKNGIVNQLRHDLLDDPRTREVRMTGNGNYDLAWLEQLAQRQKSVLLFLSLALEHAGRFGARQSAFCREC